MDQRHVCTFRHALRAAYRTAISAVQDSCYYYYYYYYYYYCYYYHYHYTFTTQAYPSACRYNTRDCLYICYL